MRDLLYALLLQSANDAAIALAEHVSGTETRFEAAMNARARQLGMDDSRFRSPNGLDDSGYSTARDLVTLTRAVYATQPEFGRIAATKFHEIPSPSGPPRDDPEPQRPVVAVSRRRRREDRLHGARGLLRRRGGAARRAVGSLPSSSARRASRSPTPRRC